MKKLIGILCGAALLSAAFTGCGMAKNATSTVSEVASDAVSGAGKVVDDIGDGANSIVSSAGSDAQDIMDGDGGSVTDDDGIIGNDDGDGEIESTADISDEVM